MDIVKVWLAGSFLMVFAVLALSATMLGLAVGALVHCIRNTSGNDRLSWIVVIWLVPVIGPILYFMLGRPKTNRPAQPPVNSSPKDAYNSATSAFHGPPIGDEIYDEKKRAASINEALRAMSASRRRG